MRFRNPIGYENSRRYFGQVMRFRPGCPTRLFLQTLPKVVARLTLLFEKSFREVRLTGPGVPFPQQSRGLGAQNVDNLGGKGLTVLKP